MPALWLEIRNKIPGDLPGHLACIHRPMYSVTNAGLEYLLFTDVLEKAHLFLNIDHIPNVAIQFPMHSIGIAQCSQCR